MGVFALVLVGVFASVGTFVLVCGGVCVFVRVNLSVCEKDRQVGDRDRETERKGHGIHRPKYLGNGRKSPQES